MKKTKIWMVIAIMLVVIPSIMTDANILQVIASISGVIYVFNIVVENKYGQLFGALNSLLNAVLMLSNGVYGTFIYNMSYCIPIQIYTFFTWGKDKSGQDRTVISRYTSKQRIGIVFIASTIITIYAIIANKLNVEFALVDGICIILGILGLYMTSRKRIEQWPCYIVTNIAMLTFWIIKCTENINNIQMAIMCVIFMLNNIYGWIAWNKKLNKDKAK